MTKKKMLAGMAVSTVLLLGGVGATSASAASNKAVITLTVIIGRMLVVC